MKQLKTYFIRTEMETIIQAESESEAKQKAFKKFIDSKEEWIPIKPFEVKESK